MEAEKRTQVEISERRREALDKLLEADDYILVMTHGDTYCAMFSNPIMALGLLKIGELELKADFKRQNE